MKIEELTVITLSDIKFLFRRNFSKIRKLAIVAAIASFGLLLLREPRFVAEATFKQGAKSSEVGMSLKETYQQLFAPPSEGATVAIMQSKEVLKGAIEALGLQADCPLDFRIVRAFKRVRDNLFLELFRRSPSDLDIFAFRNVSYSGEKPLKLFLQLTEGGRYQIFDQNKNLLGEKKVGEPLTFSLGALTVQKLPNLVKLGKLYPLTLRPLPDIATAIAKRMKIAPIKQDKNILKLQFSSRNRFLAADFLNHLMKSYQTYLKRDNDETCQAQLAYLCQRQQELTQYYDEALVDHVGYLKGNLDKDGYIGVAQEIEILSQPKNIYTSRLFDIDLELRRLSSHSPHQKREDPSYYSLEVEEVGNQIREANLLLQCVEKQEEIPPLPSLCKDPKSAVSQLMKQISLASIPWVRQLRNQLVQKQKNLEENANLQHVSDFSGIKLETAQELLSGYARERDNLQAHIRELVFLRDQIFQPDFEISSLGGVFHDSVTADLIQKAGGIALQLKDSDNRSEREQSRLQEALQTQKNFLSQYLLQTIELKKLKAKLLDDKIDSLRSTTSNLLQAEKELIAEKLTELNQNMGELPEKWRREALLEMRKELGAMMLQAVSQIAETKNLNQHIFQANSKPLDVAIPPVKVPWPKIPLLSLLIGVAAGLGYYGYLFCKTLLKGFPASPENLKVSGFPLSGSFSQACHTHLQGLPSSDLETMRRIVEFLLAQPKRSGACVAACIGGKYPKYTLSLAELLSMRGMKVLAVDCVFDQAVQPDETPGIWQYLNNPALDLPLRHTLMFDHLPSGGTTRHAAEFIGGPKFASFISRMKQNYDFILLFSSADAASAEGHAFLAISDAAIVTAQQERKDELHVYVDWANKKGAPCATFVYVEEFS
jgi:tyrosine-protein kinase Etk/Wzc